MKWTIPAQVPEEIAGLLSRRQVLMRAGALSAGGLVLSALPVADRILASVPPADAAVNLVDATLQAVADTLIPGRQAQLTDLGNEIHPQAIAGVHHEPGAVETDALLLFHSPLIGFDLLAPAFLAELQARSLLRGGQFLDLPFDVARRGRRRRADPVESRGAACGRRRSAVAVHVRSSLRRRRRNADDRHRRRATRSWATRAPRRTDTPTTRTGGSSRARSPATATCRRS